MISIIHIFEVSLCFFFGHTILLPKFYDVFLEVAEKLFFSDTTYVGKSIVYGNIHQVIQITEYTDFAEFGYSGKQGKLDILVATLHYSVKSFQCITIVVQQRFVPYGLKHGFIIFINEDHDGTIPFLGCSLNYSLETQRQIGFTGAASVKAFPNAQRIIQHAI